MCLFCRIVATICSSGCSGSIDDSPLSARCIDYGGAIQYECLIRYADLELQQHHQICHHCRQQLQDKRNRKQKEQNWNLLLYRKASLQFLLVLKYFVRWNKWFTDKTTERNIPRTDLNRFRLTSKNPPQLMLDGFISVARKNILISVWASEFIQLNSTISNFFWKFVRTCCEA